MRKENRTNQGEQTRNRDAEHEEHRIEYLDVNVG